MQYLATGDNFIRLSYAFQVVPNTISLIVYETCEAIISRYMEEVIDCPTMPEGWKKMAKGFADQWNFYATIGAIDGKHIAMCALGNSWFYYYNYRGSTQLSSWQWSTLTTS